MAMHTMLINKPPDAGMLQFTNIYNKLVFVCLENYWNPLQRSFDLNVGTAKEVLFPLHNLNVIQFYPNINHPQFKVKKVPCAVH